MQVEFAPTPRNEPAKKFLALHQLLPHGGEGDAATRLAAQSFPENTGSVAPGE